MRDYLLMIYRTATVDREAREQRGITAAASSSPHIASPEVIVDQESRRLYPVVPRLSMV